MRNQTNACKLLLLLVLIAIGHFSHAQEQLSKYWILLKDKNTAAYDYRKHLSQEAIDKRKQLGIPLEQYTDIPLKKSYLEQIEGMRVQLISQSKWLNAVSAKLSSRQQEQLMGLPFVKGLVLISSPMEAQKRREQPIASAQSGEQVKYGYAVSQLAPQALLLNSLSAEGVIVGIIDAGFHGAKENPYLSHIFEENRMLGVRDFLLPEKKEGYFTKAETHSDWHGTRVWQMIAGWDKKTREQYGLATHARFYLARTEDGQHEFRGEEDYWINALEWMDSLGVRIINTSLGYADSFDKEEENYKPEQMDGRTALISRAASIAVKEKGLFLVASAGNEGSNSSWKVVSAPADSEGVIAVGATNKVGIKAGYSSYGPEALPYVKPDVVCYAPDGTSFSAPIITGLVACLMQQYPTVKQPRLSQVLKESASLYPYGNLEVGYGIPQADRALSLLGGEPLEPSIIEVSGKGKKEVSLKGTVAHESTASNAILLFHKIDDRQVLKTEVLRTKKGRIKLKRPEEGVLKTTVLFPDYTGMEIVW